MKKNLLYPTLILLSLALTNTVCHSSDEATNSIEEDIEINKYDIDLDDPGELNKLAVRNPEHHRIIKEISYKIISKKTSEITDWLIVDYGATSASLQDLTWLTTHPPRKRLFFVLDGISYRLTFTVDTQPTTLELSK